MKATGRGSIAMGGLTPLLDTLFILLFSLLALSDVRSTDDAEEIRVQLPGVQQGEGGAPAPGRTVTLELGVDGEITVRETGEVVSTREELDRALATVVGEGVPEEVVVEIQGDRNAPHGVAVELLQHLRLRGFVRVELLATGVEHPQGPFGGDGR